VKRWGDDLVRPACCYVVPMIYEGMFTTEAVEHALTSLAIYGSYAAPRFMQPEGVVIYHVQGNLLFKKTILKDEEPKGKEGHGKESLRAVHLSKKVFPGSALAKGESHSE